MKKFIYIIIILFVIGSIVLLVSENNGVLKAYYSGDKEIKTSLEIERVVPTPSPTPIKSGPTVFFGDSITEGLKIFGFFKQDVVLGINSLSTLNASNHIEEITMLDPSKVFILIGINDLWGGDPVNDYIKRYEKFIIDLKLKCPDTKIYIQSLFPVSVNALKRNQQINNKIIDEANLSLKDMAKRQAINYIDINSTFKDDVGNMKSEYTNDGVHVIVNYYPIWTGILEKYK